MEESKGGDAPPDRNSLEKALSPQISLSWLEHLEEDEDAANQATKAEVTTTV